MIIDDASHASYDQQLGFAKLFEAVEPGGFYVLEDLHWQPPTYEDSLPKCDTTRRVFDAFLGGNDLVLPATDRESAARIADDIANVFVQRQPGVPDSGAEVKMIAVQRKRTSAGI